MPEQQESLRAPSDRKILAAFAGEQRAVSEKLASAGKLNL